MYYILFVLLVILCPVAADANSVYTNEPAGFTQRLNCGWDTTTCGGQIWNLYNSGTIVSSNGPVSPSNALKSWVDPCTPSPGCSGGGEWLYPANSSQAVASRSIFVGLHTKFDMETSYVGGTKMFYLRAFNWSFGGATTNGYVIVMNAGSGNGFLRFVPNTGGLDNSHITGTSDPGWWFTCNIASCNISSLNYHKVEILITASTTTTSRDGVVRIWLDGTRVLDYTNMNYGSGIVNEWVFAQTWDGNFNGCCPTRQWYYHLDHTYISTSASGGGGGVTPPPLPPPPPPIPAAPSDLRFGFLGDLYAWLRWLNG